MKNYKVKFTWEDTIINVEAETAIEAKEIAIEEMNVGPEPKEIEIVEVENENL